MGLREGCASAKTQIVSYFSRVQHSTRLSPAIRDLHALVAGIGPCETADAEAPSTRASLESQVSSAGLYDVEQLYTQRYGMTRGIPYVQYLRDFVKLSDDLGEDAAVMALREDLLRAQANDEPAEWPF